MNTLSIRPSAIYALLMVIPFHITALILAALAWRFPPALILISVLISGWAIYKFWYIRLMVYSLDAEVLHSSTGIFLRRMDSLELYRVKDYIVTRNLLMQLFGLSNLTLLTTDLTGPVLILRGISHSGLPDMIRERVQQARANNKILELN